MKNSQRNDTIQNNLDNQLHQLENILNEGKIEVEGNYEITFTVSNHTIEMLKFVMDRYKLNMKVEQLVKILFQYSLGLFFNLMDNRQKFFKYSRKI